MPQVVVELLEMAQTTSQERIHERVEQQIVKIHVQLVNVEFLEVIQLVPQTRFHKRIPEQSVVGFPFCRRLKTESWRRLSLSPQECILDGVMEQMFDSLSPQVVGSKCGDDPDHFPGAPFFGDEQFGDVTVPLFRFRRGGQP